MGGYISDTWQLEVIRATVIILPGFVTRIRNTDLIIEEITAAISASYRSTCFSRNNDYPTRDSSPFRFVQFLQISNSGLITIETNLFFPRCLRRIGFHCS